MKHTKEPWAITKASWQTSLIVAPHNGWTVAELSIEDNEDTAEADGAIRDANAARIVACVNACAGINPEVVPEMVVLLEKLQSEIGFSHSDHLKAMVRATLAKAKGVHP